MVLRDNMSTPFSDAGLNNLTTYKDMAEGSDIILNIWKTNTDPIFWDSPVDINKMIISKQATIYFIQVMMEIIWMKPKGEVLYSSFQEDFEG